MAVRRGYLLAVVLVLAAAAVAGRKVVSLDMWLRLDADSDGLVTGDELQGFADGERRKGLWVDVENQWQHHGLGPDERLTFDQYERDVFNHENDPGHSDEMKRLLARTKQNDRRRFQVSDQNQDGGLDKDELMTFLWAEEFPHMHDTLALEFVEEMDRDGDNAVSYREFTVSKSGIKDGYGAKQVFKKFDKDADGNLSLEEMKQWVLSPVSERTKQKVEGVLRELDRNKDGKLSRAEINPKVIRKQLMDSDEPITHDEF
ncbi:calumenin-B-like [Branchiostoma lanceolatum]|uniref:calumenin-B-like n=1 Tax=Branchiostoma lanceolatum TaxID=7740 RepID=UPI003456AA6B